MPKKSKNEVKSYDNWNNKIRKPSIKSRPEWKKEFKTSSEVEVKPLYVPSDGLHPKEYNKELSYPGVFPFTRGIQPSMYRGKLWTMRQYAGFGSAEESNNRYKYLLAHGQTGLSVAFDLPTQMGYDSDNPLAEAEVGKVGVAIDSLLDMEILLKGIPLDKVSTSMTINATATTLLALYIAVADKNKIPREKLNGTIQNDILKEYIARGTYIYPPKPSLRLITDTFTFCKKELPNWNTISISGYHIREAGATAVQEVAFTIANAITYVKAAVDSGLKVDDFAPRISFFFNVHNNFLEEIAKFRAARRLWAKIMQNQFKAKADRSCQMRFHSQTAGSTLTAQQPDNNITRVTLQALAAVLGGTQSLHTNSKDEALSLPTEHAAQIALRTQQVIAYESGVIDTPDPLAGSYYIESLTDKIESDSKKLIDQITKRGGVIKSIEDGFVQRQIQESAYKAQKKIESGENIIVGMNKFVTSEELKSQIHSIDKLVTKKQKERLTRLRQERSHQAVSSALNNLENAAKTKENLLPLILEAVKEYATVGEISDRLRKVFGTFNPTTSI